MKEFSRVFGGSSDSFGLRGFVLRYPKKTPALNLEFIKEQLVSSPDILFGITDTTQPDGSIDVRINYQEGILDGYGSTQRMTLTLAGSGIIDRSASLTTTP